jgi:hypothetical protein
LRSSPAFERTTAAFLQALSNGQTSVEPTGLTVAETPTLTDQLTRIVSFRVKAGLTQSASQLTTSLVNSLVALGQVKQSDANALIATVLQGISCATDVSSHIQMARSGYSFNFTTQRFMQTVTLTNSGTTAVQGPMSLVLTGLSSNATLFNKNGSTTCASPVGSPFINLAGPLNPGAHASVSLQFADPTKAAITYSTLVLSGNGNR